MTCVALLGGTGRLGTQVLGQLLNRGFDVRMLVHRREPRPLGDVRIVRGDARDGQAIATLMDGADIVVSTLGSADASHPDVSSTAIGHVITAMRARSIKRILSVTGSAARLDREIGSEHPWLAARRSLLMRHMAGLILDGEEHMRRLVSSGLDWTVLRAPIMTAEPRGVASLSAAPPPPDTAVGYEAVSAALVRELVGREWIGQAPFACRP
jgi:putative NADH-flavin reductase